MFCNIRSFSRFIPSAFLHRDTAPKPGIVFLFEWVIFFSLVSSQAFAHFSMAKDPSKTSQIHSKPKISENFWREAPAIKRPIVDLHPSSFWRRNFHFGLAVGYSFVFMPGFGFEHSLNLMPIMEIRWVRPKGSSFKSSDRVLRFGLKFDVAFPESYFEDDDNRERSLFHMGLEMGFRMYWPGENRSGKIRFLHGPLVVHQYSISESWSRGIGQDENRQKHHSFYRFWTGYEAGIEFLEHFQLSFRVENLLHIAVIAEINIAYVF